MRPTFLSTFLSLLDLPHILLQDDSLAYADMGISLPHRHFVSINAPTPYRMGVPYLFGVLCLCTLLIGCQSASLPEPTTTTNTQNQLKLESGGVVRYVDPAAFDFTGTANVVWPNGKQQSGTWKNGKLHGYGTQAYKGQTYTGSWVHGRQQGRGRQERDDGYVYDGEWQGNLRHGYGVARWPNQSIYQGEWASNQREGFGSFTTPTGKRYEGEWHADRRHGYGHEWLPNHARYRGMWHFDQRSGFGRELRPDGSYFVGNWHNNLPHGRGSERRSDGTHHDGLWRHGQVSGYGTRTTHSGLHFSGMWRQNAIDRGRLRLPDGEIYDGPLFGAAGQHVAEPLITWLKHQADPAAKLLLGIVYTEFEHPHPSERLAFTWLRQAATLPEAQFRLAKIMLNQGTDHDAALELLSNASQAGYGPAATRLAQFYELGWIVAPDLHKARQLYEIGIAGGDIDAYNKLAWLLATTPTTLADPTTAFTIIGPIAAYFSRWQYLDTLAACHARLGEFTAAASVQRAAVHAAKTSLMNDGTLADLEQRLALYVQQRPYLTDR